MKTMAFIQLLRQYFHKIHSTPDAHYARLPLHASEEETLFDSQGLDFNIPLQEYGAEYKSAGGSTGWQGEAKILSQNAAPMALSFLLQYSLSTISIIAVGHLGTVELGATSLASMTANISGYYIYHGLTTSLDTLCAQAYGSGKKDLVALHFQRMLVLLSLVTVPIMCLWIFSEGILVPILPDKETAALTGQYLRVASCGTLAYAFFEAGKHYVQAQGMYSAPLYVLLVCTPINAFMHWFLIWKLDWGYIGAPIAMTISDNLLPCCLFIYVYYSGRDKCWNSWSQKAFHSWGPMIKLAIPGLLAVEGESLTYELLTLASSYLGQDILAAQTVLFTVVNIAYQIPYSLSISVSIRVGNLIGAERPEAGQLSAKVSLYLATGLGAIGMILMWAFKYEIARVFDTESAVVELVASVMPLCAVSQLLDCYALAYNGIMCGLGRQDIAGYVQLVAQNVITLPIGLMVAFGFGWHIWGIWAGVVSGLVAVIIAQWLLLRRVSWEKCVEEATFRNSSV